MRGIGLTVLCAATLIDFVDVYASERLSVSSSALLENMKLGFSIELTSLMTGCLSVGKGREHLIKDLDNVPL
jgi:hypothetical protein